MPPAIPEFITFYFLYEWPTGGGGWGNAETNCEPPCLEVEAELLNNVWIRQEQGWYNDGVGNSLVYPSLAGTYNWNQRKDTSVGGRVQLKHIQVKITVNVKGTEKTWIETEGHFIYHIIKQLWSPVRHKCERNQLDFQLDSCHTQGNFSWTGVVNQDYTAQISQTKYTFVSNCYYYTR